MSVDVIPEKGILKIFHKKNRWIFLLHMDANESLIVRQLSIEKSKRKTELAACITVHKLSGLSLWHVSHLPKQKELLISFDNLFIFCWKGQTKNCKLRKCFDKRLLQCYILLPCFSQCKTGPLLKPWPSHIGMCKRDWRLFKENVILINVNVLQQSKGVNNAESINSYK